VDLLKKCLIGAIFYNLTHTDTQKQCEEHKMKKKKSFIACVKYLQKKNTDPKIGFYMQYTALISISRSTTNTTNSNTICWNL